MVCPAALHLVEDADGCVFRGAQASSFASAATAQYSANKHGMTSQDADLCTLIHIGMGVYASIAAIKENKNSSDYEEY